jgi:hypothetical protein
LEQFHREKQRQDAIWSEASAAAGDVQESKRAISAQEEHLEKLRREIVSAETELNSRKMLLQSREEKAEKLRLECLALVAPNTVAVREKIATAEDTNRKVRANAQRVSLRRQLSDSEDLADALTMQIAKVDAEKAALIESAKLPVPGLAFDEDGPTLNGIALSQCSQAERLRVSVAVGLAFNPKLRVMLIREGAFLDEDALALLAELAEQADAQVFIERVGTADEAAIIIEDGEIVARERGAAE